MNQGLCFATASSENLAARRSSVGLSRVSVSQPDDAPEREANRLAEGVEPQSYSSQPLARSPVGEAPRSVWDAIRSSGRPLTSGERAASPRIVQGVVRLHDDAAAHRASRDLLADAFAVGRHVVVGSRYEPGTPQGRRLISHELAHIATPGPLAVRRQGTPTNEPRLFLRDLRGRAWLPWDVLEQTEEFRAYIDPKLRWQTELHATRAEARDACVLILAALNQHRTVDWEREAKRFLLQARKRPARQQPAEPPSRPSSPVNPHYRIELKAWIPHLDVVDPEAFPGGETTYFRGDGHDDYDGSYRVLAWAEFDWDGVEIANFSGGGSFGASHRDHYSGSTLVSTDTKTATSATVSTHPTPYTFELGISSANPLVHVWAPTIDSQLAGMMAGDAIILRYRTDRFPSHGFRVYRDGRVVDTEIVRDVRFVPADDPIVGPLFILAGLTTMDNSGVVVVPAAPESGVPEDVPPPEGPGPDWPTSVPP